jgi:hypothetical protein
MRSKLAIAPTPSRDEEQAQILQKYFGGRNQSVGEADGFRNRNNAKKHMPITTPGSGSEKIRRINSPPSSQPNRIENAFSMVQQ